MLLTLPAVAVYLRALLVEQVAGHPGDRLPAWFQLLQQAGIARIEAKAQLVKLSGVSFERDATLFALPIAAGFPQVLVYLSLAGALAAALAALASSLVTIAAILAEDVVHGLPNETAPDAARMSTARLALLGAAFVTAWLAIAAPADPLQLFLWSLTFGAAGSFPVLLLAIWGKRTNAWGALACMAAGFVVTAVGDAAGRDRCHRLAERRWPVPSACRWRCAPASSSASSRRRRGGSALDIVRDVRVPGGETVYDREMRLLRLKSRAPRDYPATLPRGNLPSPPAGM